MELITPLEKIFRLSDSHKKALKKMRIGTVRDVLYHFPARYAQAGGGRTIGEVAAGEKVTLYGTVSKLKTSKGFRTKIPMSQAHLEDGSGRIKLVWFHQPYIAKMIADGAQVKVSGKVAERKGELYISNPEVEQMPAGTISGASLFGKESGDGLLPVYPESRGVTSLWFHHAVRKLFKAGFLKNLEDPIPADILKRYNLPALKTALVWIHTPKSEHDSLASRKRFAFEEIFLIQLAKQRERLAADALPSWNITPDPAATQDFIARFPFSPTTAQEKALDDIFRDFADSHAMSRLLEGDVGSGKTFVAAATAHAVVTTHPFGKDFGNLQAAYMAPTEILANQHFESFIEYFKNLPIQIGLITSSGCKKFPSKLNPASWTDISRPQLLKWAAEGVIPILIGTHALIQKKVQFKHLAYVIIDEQHRFGTRQRAKLARKGTKLPHLLSMSATPIPRTLALTIYGDLDLTLLDEMPAGRNEIKTKVVKPDGREKVYEHIRELINDGRQAYVICPRIEEPDPAKQNALRTKSVEEEAKNLKKIFPEFTIGMLHGKLSAEQKEKTMQHFAAGGINLLVATSVIEVGVNVENATVIVIEGAERFGLAQLHQLRGRVLRSEHQAHCYLFADTKSKTALARLTALTTAQNGFELAEEDLKLRGAGALYGAKQWGISDVGMEALKNLKLVEAARTEARQLIEHDPDLTSLPLLKSAVEERDNVHFE